MFASTTPASDLWVFGYGSLMWNPGFEFIEAVPARLAGYHRAFCIYSMHYRGTPRAPGLVLGLDRGGACEGMAFRVSAETAARVRHYLRVRELVTGVYREAMVPVTLIREGWPEVMALTFIAERAHPAYAGDLDLRRQVRLVRTAAGLAGNNIDYVLSTACHLRLLGIRERRIERLVALMGPHLTSSQTSSSQVAQRSADQATNAARTRSMSQNAQRRSVEIRARRLGLAERKRFFYRRALNGG